MPHCAAHAGNHATERMEDEDGKLIRMACKLCVNIANPAAAKEEMKSLKARMAALEAIAGDKPKGGKSKK